MTVTAVETKATADYPFKHPARTAGEKAIVKAVEYLDAIGDADYVLHDFSYAEIRAASRMIDDLRKLRLEGFFTLDQCVGYSSCPRTRGRGVRAFNMLLRLGIIEKLGAPDEDNDAAYFALNLD